MIGLKELKRLTNGFVVLFVEDDDALLNNMVSIFERFFKRVDTANNGEEGLEAYTNYYETNGNYYDIVISDIQMPKLNGIEMCKEIFTINHLQQVIITSAHNDKEYLLQLINLGVAGFFSKPIDNQEFFNVLHNVSLRLKSGSKIDLRDGYLFDIFNKRLYHNNQFIELSLQEQKLLELLCKNTHQYFSAVDIFNYIYYDKTEKEFSGDSIKSLIKRLRKKLPEDTICNTPNLGYYIKSYT